MKLTKLEIQNYRSVANAQLPIDPSLTTLVGANEHGKTNLLWAIRLLDFKTPINESDKRMSKSSGTADTVKVLYEFELGENDCENIEKNYSDKAIITRPAQSQNARVRVISNVQHDGQSYEAGAEFELPLEQAQPLVDAGSAEMIIQEPQAEQIPETQASESITIPSSIRLEIAYNDGTTNRNSILNNDLPDTAQQEVLTYIQSVLGDRIFYFDTFDDRLKHRIPKEEIINKENDITNGLMKLAGLRGKESLIFEDTSVARQARLNGERKLTKQLQSLWVQGKEDKIEAKLSISNDGNFLNVDIEDLNTYGDISTRSRGFLFFLSFILKFKEYHDGDLVSFIFLIDEPGIFLHPRGQKDLLLYLEKLSEFNQLIYTTHSPFMINRLNNFRIRVVSKDKDSGTKVDLKPFIHNWKSLRASLGMMLADSFYYADNNLIVEGSSDRLYILSLLKIFHEKELIKSDLNILSIIDSGGCSNVPTMVQIVKSEERPLVVFIDSDTQGNNAKGAVVRRGVDEDTVRQVADFKSGAITIEDLLPRKYLNIAINAYIDELVAEGICMKPEKEFNSKVSGGVVEALKKYLSDNNCGVDEISKLNVARHFEEAISNIPKDKFQRKDFSDCEGMVMWIRDVLKIKLEETI